MKHILISLILLVGMLCPVRPNTVRIPGPGGVSPSGGASGPTLMSNHFKQSLGASGGTTSPGINTTGAKLELVKLGFDSSGCISTAPSTILDSAGNTLAKVAGYTGGSGANILMYAAFAPTTGSSVTWNYSCTSGYIAIEVSLYSYSGTFSGSTEDLSMRQAPVGPLMAPALQERSITLRTKSARQR